MGFKKKKHKWSKFNNRFLNQYLTYTDIPENWVKKNEKSKFQNRF